MTTKKIMILMGGRSSEHEVSLTSARAILNNINAQKFSPIPVLIARDGQWYWLEHPQFILGNTDKLLSEQTGLQKYGYPALLDYTCNARLIHRDGKEIAQVDAVFPVLHGPYGEDGTIQGLCKMANIPCVGPGILGSALGLDKVMMKQIFLQNHLPVLPYFAFSRQDWIIDARTIESHIRQQFHLPIFIKPSNAGSSVGISKVKSWDDLSSAVAIASKFDYKILVEQGISVRELECAVVGNQDAKASIVGEVIPCREFYDYEAKYIAEGSTTEIPANIPASIQSEIQALAIQAFHALDCCGMSRVDFFLDKETNKVYLNEINTIPGFTSISMYPVLWKHSGLEYGELITRLIELAFQKHKDTCIQEKI